jgi:hypothetical protein
MTEQAITHNRTIGKEADQAPPCRPAPSCQIAPSHVWRRLTSLQRQSLLHVLVQVCLDLAEGLRDTPRGEETHEPV